MIEDERLRQKVNPHQDDGEFYLYVFIRDASFVVPYSISDSDGPQVEIVGDDSRRVSDLIRQALGQTLHSDGISLVDAFRDMFNQVAKVVLRHGKATAEIDYLVPADTDLSDDPLGFRFELIPPTTLSSRWRRPIQFVPPEMSDRRIKGVPYVDLDPSQLVTFQASSQRRRDLARIVHVLMEASDSQRREIDMFTGARSGEISGYDSSTHHRAIESTVLQAASSIGWFPGYGIGEIPKGMSFPYTLWRRIQFLAFRAELREAFLLTLNEALLKVGERMNFSAQLKLRNVQTVQEIQDVERRLKEGTIPLSAVALMG